MNQAASATRRAPADSTTPAGCCPMLNAPFFTAAPQCFLSSQAQQLVQLARQPQQQSNVVLQPQQQTVSQQPPTVSGQQHQLQAQPQQLTTRRSHDQNSNNYNTSLTAPSFMQLQHILANRHSASNCMALAAAALANLPPFQQQLLTQNHQATPINQQTQTVAPSTAVNQVTHSNAAPTITNQVPILNYNSYSSAQPFINLPTLAVPQSAPPPVAAYLGHQQQQQQQQPQQTNSIPNILSSNLDTIAQNTVSNSANNLHQNVQQPRPLVTNTSLNSSAGQISNSMYRSVQQQQSTEQQVPNIHQQQQQQQQQQPSTPAQAQQLGQATRSISSDDTLTMFNSQIQAMLINQLLSNPQFPPSLLQLQPQQIAAPQQLVNTSRTQTTLPLTGQSPIVMTPAQQVTSTQQIVPPQQHQPSLEQASENQQQQQQQVFNQSTIQSRVNQAPQPLTSTNDSYRASANNTASGSYQPHPNNDSHNQPPPPPPNPVLQAHQGPQSSPQAPPPLQPQSHQQQQQPQTGLPPMPYYGYPQDRSIEQAMAFFSDPRLASDLFGNILMLFQNNLRSESHHAHHHHPTHHFHHLHGAHNHHGQNGPTNGQDASMPLDSLAINESKPRGLSRAEIDSLTPYIHTNEKDARTCVICLSKFELKSKIRPLPCNHAFHAKCVDKWLRTNRTCPICRRDALKTFNGKIKRI